MKKILGLAVGLVMTVFTFGQDVTFTDAGDGYNKAETTEFNFEFGESITHDKITEASQYYTDYFTVSVTDQSSGHAVKIELKQDDKISRKVIERLFITLNQREINVNGETISLDDFMSEYIEL